MAKEKEEIEGWFHPLPRTLIGLTSIVTWLYALFTLIYLFFWLNNFAVLFPSWTPIVYLFPGCIDRPYIKSGMNGWVWNGLIDVAFYGHHSFMAR